MNKRTQITLARAGLLVGYIVAAALLSVFFGAAGDGSYAPGAVMFGWGFVPWVFQLAPGALGFLLVPIVYLLCLFTVVTVFGRSLLPVGFHVVGVIIALITVEHGHLAVGGWLVASYIVPSCFAVGYLWCDLRLSRRAQQVAPHEPPPRASVLDAPDDRTLDSLPAPGSSGGR
jgi:hypothetical protein